MRSLLPAARQLIGPILDDQAIRIKKPELVLKSRMAAKRRSPRIRSNA
ncbi:MAG: hypothetical protein ACE5OQ_13580 [Woeseia sp.]